jgi:sugar phosphate isomerase/epimerase
MTPKIGLQLCSLKDILVGPNFSSVLEHVRKIGYRGVEAVERDGDPDTVHTFCGKSATEVRAVLDDLDLEVISSHVGFDDLQRNFKEITRYHETIGCSSLLVAGIPGKFFRDRQSIRDTLAELKRVAAEVNAGGFDFGFHNCPFNFIDPTGYELFEEELDEDLPLQPDSGNAMMVQIDPVEYFGRIPNRFVSLHIKDSKIASDEDIPLDKSMEGKVGLEPIWSRFAKLSVRIGQGDVDIDGFLQLGIRRNVDWVIVEEELDPDPLKVVESAYKHLNGLLSARA